MTVRFFNFSVALLWILVGCNYHEDKLRRTTSTDGVGFNEVRELVLAPNCLGCHGGNHPPTLLSF